MKQFMRYFSFAILAALLLACSNGFNDMLKDPDQGTPSAPSAPPTVVTVIVLSDYLLDYNVSYSDAGGGNETNITVSAGTSFAVLPANRIVKSITTGGNTHLIGRKTGEAILLNLTASGDLLFRPAGSDGNISIGSYAELQEINATANLAADKHYKLEADLDLMNEPFTRIGTGSGANSFSGTFDGQDHNLSNLKIEMPSTDNVGLFGYLGNSGAISNLAIASGSITGKGNVGGVVGNNSGGTITNSYNRANVTGASNVGGVIGNHYQSRITASYNIGKVLSQSSAAGGVVGDNNDSTLTANYWADHTDGADDNASFGIGSVSSDENTTKFSVEWPSEVNASWGLGNDPASGKYWKTLGSSPSNYPKLWWE